MTFFGTLDQAKPLMEGKPLTSDVDVNGNALIGVRLIEGLPDLDLFINSGQNIEYGVPTGFQFNIGVGGNYKQSITESEMTVSVPINFNGPEGEIRTNNIDGNIKIIPDGTGKVVIGGSHEIIDVAIIRGKADNALSFIPSAGEDLQFGEPATLPGSVQIYSASVTSINSPLDAGKINSSANALPVASATYRGQIRTLEGGTGARDRNYLCLKSDAGAYSWVEVANGGA